jgi:predicted nucleotidyltransferase
MSVQSTLERFFEHDGRGAVAVYLFGSVARGTASPRSDVDVAILFERAPEPTLDAQPFGLKADLEALLGRPVDLVVLNRASPDLTHRVLRDGQLVFESDRSARVRFEVRSRSAYFDMLPIWREYRHPREEAR